MSIKLSILIATVPSRIEYFYPSIMKQLLDQTEEYKDIEILALFDNKKRSIGKKRQEMINIAQGEYIVFVDDDDRIAKDYIKSIMTALYNNLKIDVVVFNQICTINGGKGMLCKYGIEFEYGKINGGSEWRGKPAHTMVWRSDIVKKHKYSDRGNGEDIEWVKRASKDIKTQVRIDKTLYYYDANYSTTSEAANLSDETINKHIAELLRQE